MMGVRRSSGLAAGKSDSCMMSDAQISRNKGSLLLPGRCYCNVVAFSPTSAGEEGVDHPRHPTTPRRPSSLIGPRC
jgi:hypothetical protein